MRVGVDGKKRRCSCSPADCAIQPIFEGGIAWAELEVVGGRGETVQVPIESHAKLDALRAVVREAGGGVVLHIFTTKEGERT